MKLTIEDVVPLQSSDSANRERIRRRPVVDGRLSRRTMLKIGVFGAASALTVHVARVLPGAPAGATHAGTYGYRIQGGCQGATGYDQYIESCDRPCGPSQIFADACHPVRTHLEGYHKNNGTCYGCYTLRPGACNGVDGWKWNHLCAPCRPAYNVHYRCHDGWKNYAGQRPRLRSICKWAVACV
jgi:hypothetical protein